MRHRVVWTALAVFALVVQVEASAAIVITEAMSSSGHEGPANGDWFEITNTGPDAVNLDGYFWDDDGPTGDDGASFPDVTINAGDSWVILNEDDASAFLTAWGGGFTVLPRSLFTGNDDFSSLSSGGDQIQIWDANPNVGAANLVSEVSFGAATAGVSFEWFTNGASGGLSVDGEFGAFTAAGDGDGGVGSDVASPGFATVPEPGSGMVALFGGIGLLFRRRTRA